MLPLYPKQQAIIDDDSRFTITEATTKAGKTMSHIEWQLWEIAELGRGNHWWVAPISDQADIAFRRAKDRLRGFIDSGGEMIRVSDPYPFRANETRKYIEFAGGIFWFKSADKPDSLFGEDVYTLTGDEITRWKKESWNACYTTLTATKGRGKLIGNVKGKKNFAYKLARTAEAGKQGWGYHKLTAYDAIEGGVIDNEIVEQARQDLAPAVFKELYEAEASDDGSNPFGIEAIRSCIRTKSQKRTAVYGVDLAKSIDWTWVIGLDEDGNQTVSARFQKDWRATSRAIVQLVGSTPALVDSTGVGDPIVEQLQAECDNVTGYSFTRRSKQQLMEGLAYAIQRNEVGFWDEVLISELEDFEYEYTGTGTRYSAPEGLHDDGVCALALAVQRLSNVVDYGLDTGWVRW